MEEIEKKEQDYETLLRNNDEVVKQNKNLEK